MYNATPIPGGALRATAVSPGFEPELVSACRLHSEEYP